MNNIHPTPMALLLESNAVVDYFELKHDACLKNMLTAYTSNPESLHKAATFISRLVTGFSSPAVFDADNLKKIEVFITDDSEYMSMSLVYAMQIFKHGHDYMVASIAAMIAQAWDINYAGPPYSAEECEKLISNFPAYLIVFMCMLFPNTSIGMLNQLMTAPSNHAV